MTSRPTMNALWEQAWEEHGSDDDARRERYRALLLEHGYTKPREAEDDDALPCGFRGSDF